jgi:hypothetical protein
MDSINSQSPGAESEVEDLLARARVQWKELRRLVARGEELSSSTPEERQAWVLSQEAVQHQLIIGNQIRHIEAFAETGKASRPLEGEGFHLEWRTLEGEVRHLESTILNATDLVLQLDSLFNSLEL